MWGFNETGTRLAASGESDDKRYATWIDMYSGEEFTELTDWCKGLMNDVATNATEATVSVTASCSSRRRATSTGSGTPHGIQEAWEV